MSSLKSKFMMVLAIISIAAIPTAALAEVSKSDIQGLYVAYYGRPADPRGLEFWLSTAQAAQTKPGATDESILSSMENSFAENSEFKSNYDGLSSDQKVAKIYMNLFGREIEPAGLAYWSLPLAQGKISLSYIVQQVRAGAQGADLEALKNKISAATTFTDHVDTTSEILGYTGVAAGQQAKNWLQGIKDPTTLTTAIANVDATIAIVTNADAAAKEAADAAAKAIADAAAKAAADAVAKAAAEAASAASYNQP